MRPPFSLPIDRSFVDENAYIESLLRFATSSSLFQTLCGGVHILDFLTKKPSLYSTLFPDDWIEWFQARDVQDLLKILLHDDVSLLKSMLDAHSKNDTERLRCHGMELPPQSFIEYVLAIRKHSLRRVTFENDSSKVNGHGRMSSLPIQIAVGMKPKKIHEVQHFVKYIDDLTDHVSSSTSHEITHLIDFGSGQNYLGRALAYSLPDKMITAIESRQLNINGAKAMDIAAKITKKEMVLRDKKIHRSITESQLQSGTDELKVEALPLSSLPPNQPDRLRENKNSSENAGGRITYIQALLQDGNLFNILEKTSEIDAKTKPQQKYLVIALHSCGNLLHHGLRSLFLNPTVKAVALVGCCYNLVTERLGPPTFKLPSLRTPHPRLEKTSSACDPHGFPMSEKLVNYKHPGGEGIRLNITARMMAVQAPQNWTDSDCESFFTRHFYRALLQKMFYDRGLIPKPNDNASNTLDECSPEGSTAGGTPIIIGSLRKSCYSSFKAYVHGALQKLSRGDDFGARIAEGMTGVTDEEIAAYVEQYKEEKKRLSIVWSLMAFSASVVESIILVDRWLYLKEHPELKDCWVEPIFDYKQSPRNLVVVGIKR